MLFDPDAGKTFEQIIDGIWRSLSPDVQAHYEQVMAGSGRSWKQLCREAEARFEARWAEAMNNPDSPLARAFNFKAFPRGTDPLVERGRPL